MQSIDKEGTDLRYSTPNPETNIIEVIHRLPNNSEVVIGKLYPQYENDDETVSYLPVDSTGEELMNPTLEFSLIEKRFAQLIKEENKKTLMEDMQTEAEKTHERESLLHKIRYWRTPTTKLLNR